ncbi:uncharacterized protein DEA37_0013107, partial [Paragonimus westermani]
TIRLLEEREALQLEYERLSERAPWPASNNHLATTCREIQAQQQHQERMARTRLQQQQQDATRANMVGGYAPRMSMQRSPSASPPLPNVPSIIRLNSYSSRLRRATCASNGFNYPRDLYGSEPRVCAYPYGSTLGPEFNLNALIGADELATEALLSCEHRVCLEVRVQQLEYHNKQLEQELQYLRQHLRSGWASSTGTLPGTIKGAADLLFFDPSNAETTSSLFQVYIVSSPEGRELLLHRPQSPTDFTKLEPHSPGESPERAVQLHPFTSERFHALFPLPSNYFSTFPHGTCSSSDSCEYLALDGIFHPLWAAFKTNHKTGSNVYYAIPWSA